MSEHEEEGEVLTVEMIEEALRKLRSGELHRELIGKVMSPEEYERVIREVGYIPMSIPEESEMKDEEAKVEEARKVLRESIAKGLETAADSAYFSAKRAEDGKIQHDTLVKAAARIRLGEWG